MSAEKIISSWKKKEYKPLNWFEGEEDYYIDMLMNYAEHHILPESEAACKVEPTFMLSSFPLMTVRAES